MKIIQQFLFCISLFFLLHPSLGRTAPTNSKSKLTIEPIYGIETSFVKYPSPGKYVTRANYGARLIYGVQYLSGEMELSQARSHEEYMSGTQKIDDRSDRLSLGVRSTFTMTQYLGYYLRFGGRGSQGETRIDTAGVEETKKTALRVDPYAGAGIQIALGQWVAINLGATLVRNAEDKYNSEYTFGLSTRFGNY